MGDGVFVGEVGRSVDGAGRVAFPPSFRELLGDRCFATRDRQGCITIRPPETYAAEARRLAKAEKRGKQPAGVARALSARTTNLAIDKQGRITLDETARFFAHIDSGGEVVMIGLTDRIEIWRPSRWEVIVREDTGAAPDRVWPDESEAR